MQSILQSLLLLCVFQVVAGQSLPSPTKNPECPAMHEAAGHMEKTMSVLKVESSSCKVNMHCSGMNCTGSRQGKEVFLRVELHHCTKPVTLYLDIKNGDKDVHYELKDGDRKKIGKLGGVTDLYVAVHLHRNQNIVTARLDVDTCFDFLGSLKCRTLRELLPEQSFCVSMRNCPGHENSTGTPPPCVLPTTTPPPKTGHSFPKSFPSSTPPQGHSSSTRYQSSVKPSKAAEPGTGVPGVYGRRKNGHAKKGGLSVGTAVAIGFAGLVGLLIIVGVVVYWSKYHRRSRLRAAYYNDISMNDALYEDFEPATA